ncbi:MAG: SUMF1/EgtB/PvdO family nonheme iron enzyme [Bacteroidales bacterium]|nr:SUMF1/EgtB/PvdO family nonheme iron enzyme [Bacteroidales bacterium]
MNNFVSANGMKVSSIEVTSAVMKEIEGLTPTAEDNYPATNMSYATIMGFISKLNAATGRAFRLPTLAEWQALADDGHSFSGSNNIGDVAWYLGNCGSVQHGGLLKANEKGLFDMSGNVWEMTATAGPDNNSHYVCGGSFRSTEDQCVVTSKLAYPDGQGSAEIGFRIVE